MKYTSTRNSSISVSFRNALFNSTPQDGGLYMPASIPKLSPGFLRAIPEMNRTELFSHVGKLYWGADLNAHVIEKIIHAALDFPFPIVDIEGFSIMELFHGPTQAFKDVGARVMARLMQELLEEERIILTATSGDTGAAIAAAFSGLEGFKVVILYPRGRITPFQENQLLCWENNVYPIAVEGDFDTCQGMVKAAFQDRSNSFLQSRLTSANSINIGRLLPQVFYYFDAFRQIGERRNQLLFAVPCGNLGNITAGLIAKKMGLPAVHFLAANNKNDVFAKFLQTGIYKDQSTIPSPASAMDVGSPSNFERIKFLYSSTWNIINNHLTGASVSDREILETMLQWHRESSGSITLDPHTATAVAALSSNTEVLKSALGGFEPVVLATAHPVKFANITDVVYGDGARVGCPDNFSKNVTPIVLSQKPSGLQSFLLDLL